MCLHFYSLFACLSMSLPFVIEIDGFQHGNGPYHLKRIAVTSIPLPLDRTIDLALPPSALPFSAAEIRTYQAQTELHGLHPESPGCDQSVVPEFFESTIQAAVALAPAFFGVPAADIVFLVKGKQKVDILRPLLPPFAEKTVTIKKFGGQAIQMSLPQRPGP